MKKFTFLAFTAAFISFLGVNFVKAQADPTSFLRKCATVEAVETYLKNNPRNPGDPSVPPVGNGNARLQSITTIPVVVHIVMPNPLSVTDADVQAQLDALNRDFSGLNSDSTNAGGFLSLRGHSQIRFCLARRTPSGALTNGIERRASTTMSSPFTNPDPVKRFSSGGLDAWDASSYVNIWVSPTSAAGYLGYAYYPGTAGAADDGIWINYQTFGSNSCYVIPVFNKGRSVTHEIGHYLGLHHIWGDDGGSCTGDDFESLTSSGSSVVLPLHLYNPPGSGNTASDIGDTPNQANATGGCATGVVTDACANAAPGKMYQNYMDYTDDGCMTLFSKKQVDRMEWIISNARAGLVSSLGCQPPASAILLDAAPQASVLPGGTELVGCNFISHPSSFGSCGAISPKFRVVNNGLTTLTSLTVGYVYNNGTPVSQNISINIPVGGTQVVTLPAITPGPGSNTFKFFTSGPNGGVDQNPANDTLVQNFTVTSGVVLPQTADFESTTFPPASWTVVNPNNDFTWLRRTPGRAGSAGSMWINNYSVNGTNNIDEFRSPNISVTGVTDVTLTFDLAAKYYPLTGYHDTLTVLVSKDCGATWTSFYKKWGTTLATAGSLSSSYTTPIDADWRTETISLNGAILSTGQIMVAFRNTSRYGNNIHIDNINLVKPSARDIRMVSINVPGDKSCVSTFSPNVTVNNNGAQALTSFKVGYRIDNGPYTITTFTQSLAPGANVTLTLPAVTTTVGQHTIKVYAGDPTDASGTGDGSPNNDTLSKIFTVLTLANPPVVEGFENSFPPAGWTLSNPDGLRTWEIGSPGSNSPKAAMVNNYVYNAPGAIDELIPPFLNVAGADSIIFRFDLAHRNFPGANDRLSILVTTDCGNTYTPIFDKAGSALATAGSNSLSYDLPMPSDWKTQHLNLNNSFSSSGHIGFKIRNTNDYGNNIWIDNINIAGVYKRDAHLIAIKTPSNIFCSTNISPVVTVKNAGTETITAIKISYSIDNAAPITSTFTGLNLTYGNQADYTLNAGTIPSVGQHSIKIYTWDPVTSTGTGDMYTFNDTLTRQFSLAGTTAAPLSENFTSTGFPPTGWTVFNPDGGLTWQRNAAGNGNPGSAYVNTYNYSTIGQTDDLVTPSITYQGVDSVTLKFDLSASTYSYPGTTGIPIDTLTVLVSKDCGNSFTTVYKKFGEDLQTINDPNNTQLDEFTPQVSSEWRTETVDLTGLGQGPLLIYFRVSNSYENNIFIDNVNLTTRTLPARVKQQGYMVLPNPFQNGFNVWHVQQPVTMKYISVYNSAGQLVFTRQFNGNGRKVEPIDLSTKAAGVYLVKIGYEDENRNVTERVIKL